MFEIDIENIGKKIYGNRRVFLNSLVVSLIVCVLFLAVKPVTYISKTTFTPQRNTSSLSSLVSLSSFVGVSLADRSTLGDGILPMSYPEIVYSTVFLKDLMYKKIPINQVPNTVTILDYITNPVYLTWQEKFYRYSFGFLSYLNYKKSYLDYKNEHRVTISDSVFNHLTSQEQFCANMLRNMIKFEVYEKVPTIDFKVEAPNAEVAAYCSSIGYQLLFDYLLQFANNKIEKRRMEVDSLFHLAEDIRNQKHLDLAVNMDKGHDFVSYVAKSRIEKQQNEYLIATNFYNEIARERMMLQYKKAEDPLILISRPVIPNEYSNPDYFRVLFLFMFFGAIIGGLMAYFFNS